MIREGVMRDVSAVLGLHVFPSIPARSIGVRYGALTAAADDLEIFIQGESGHGPGPRGDRCYLDRFASNHHFTTGN